MTDRIRSLELDAIAYADSKVPATDRYNDIYHSIVRGKFAELIVKECIDIVEDEDTGDIYGKSARLAMVRIKQHFGVEE